VIRCRRRASIAGWWPGFCCCSARQWRRAWGYYVAGNGLGAGALALGSLPLLLLLLPRAVGYPRSGLIGFLLGIGLLDLGYAAFRKSGSVAPKRADHSNHPKKLNEEDLQFLRGLLDVGCDATDGEPADRLYEEKGILLSR
jgi:hypothetical protein